MGEYELRRSVVWKEVWVGEPLERALAGMGPGIEAAIASLSALNADPSTIQQAVSRLCERLMLEELEGNGLPDDEVERRADLLYRSLRGLPVGARIVADGGGVAVLCPPVEFRSPDGVRVSLRAVEPADLGGDVYLEYADGAARRIQSRPSALLRLEYEAVDGAGWQPHLERALAIFHLFGAGGGAWTRVETGTESLVDIYGGILLLDQDGGSWRTYPITASDAARLPRFWEAIGAALPREFYWRAPEDPVGLDAAWLNYRVEAGRVGYVNERIASVVRSLESLFLENGENQRVSPTLAGRAAALLEACGFDGNEVRRTIRWAYEVRSRHVHGGALSRGTLGKIDAGAGGLVALLERCLEYNRASLAAAVLARTDKRSLLGLLKDAAALRRVGDAYRAAHGG